MSNNYTNEIELHELIKKLRTSRGLTQNQLAEQLGYSVRQLRRIESGDFEISKDAIELLSDKFNVDIHQYKSISTKFKTMECYEEYINLRKAAESADMDYIKSKYEIIKNNPEFQDGEKLQLFLYAESLLIAYSEKDYAKSESKCFEALNLFGHTDYISSLKNGILNEMSYPLLFSLSYNYSFLEKFELSLELNIALYEHFRDTVFKNSLPLKNDMYHMKKYYIGATNNLAHAYYDLKNYDMALEFTDKAISLSNKFNMSVFTHYLLQTKFEIYYELGDIENAKKYYTLFEYTCEINGKNEYLNKIKDELKSKYNLLFL